MTTHGTSTGAGRTPVDVPPRSSAEIVRRRPFGETKASFKTTEFWIYLLAVGGVLLASLLVDSNDQGRDYFRADQAWLYIVLLTIGYLGSRGLAKSGSRHADYDDH